MVVIIHRICELNSQEYVGILGNLMVTTKKAVKAVRNHLIFFVEQFIHLILSEYKNT